MATAERKTIQATQASETLTTADRWVIRLIQLQEPNQKTEFQQMFELCRESAKEIISDDDGFYDDVLVFKDGSVLNGSTFESRASLSEIDVLSNRTERKTQSDAGQLN